MTTAVLDDHLLRDLLSGELSAELQELLDEHSPATTNLYYLRLCKSVVAARGGRLTGSWSPERRRALGRALLDLPESIEIVPVRSLAFRMAELASVHPVSTLGAEAIAAAAHLRGPLCVWIGDDGPRIREGASVTGVVYKTIVR